MNSTETFKLFEPKKSNRFTVKLGVPLNIPNYITYKGSRPVLRYENGVLKYEPMVLELYDPIGPSTSQLLMNGLKKLNTNQAVDLILEMYDPTGVVIESWDITGKLSLVDFGKLDWKSDEDIIIKVHIDVTNVVLNF